MAAMDVAGVGTWLVSTGKGAYASAFVAAGIDGMVLCDSRTTGPLLVDAVPGLPVIIASSILREAQRQQ